jgi:integral membrane protein (TIGR00529 family)
MYLTWIGFFVSIAVLLTVSRKNLALALFAAGITLGLFTISSYNIGMKIWETITDSSVVLLAVVMGIISMIGGALEISGRMDDLVNNLRIGKKPFLMFSPALIGMLPMPGGALLSAPLVEKGGVGVNPENKAALNVWFRHAFLLIYPLSAFLIVSTKIAGLDVYTVLPYLLPFFIFTVLLGYLFFLRNAEGKINYTKKFSLKKLIIPLLVIMIAPLLDFLIRSIFELPVREISLLIAVAVSFIMAFVLGNLNLNSIRSISKKMKPWNFAFIILGMFIFINIFKASGVPESIAGLTLPNTMLCVSLSFLLGIVTGRVQVPASIVIPTYLAISGLSSMPPPIFVITLFSIFIGYVISPVHPCVAVSTEYFKIKIQDFLKVAILPVFIMILVMFVLSLFFIR